MSDRVPFLRDELKGYVGQPETRPERDEIEHFELCPACQQPFDRRDLLAVLHHMEPGHEPLPAEDAERLLRIGEQLRAALDRGERPG